MSVFTFPERRPDDAPPGTIWIFFRLLRAYAGLDDANAPTAIFPLRGKLPVIGRTFGAIRIEFQPGVRIQMSGVTDLEGCCVIYCPDRTLSESFGALVASLANDLAKVSAPSAQDLGRLLGAWERLFQKRRRLSLEEEKGLWGELFFISTRSSIDTAIAAWQGPNAEDYDFLSGGVAVEVKTSSHFGTHRISHGQVNQAAVRRKVFLISLWVAEDPFRGSTLGSLVELLTKQVSDPIQFEEKLLATGYSRGDAALYDRKLVALEDPLCFDMADIPRVREFDDGITNLVYTVQLDRPDALDEEECKKLLSRAFP